MSTQISPELIDSCEILRADVVFSDGTQIAISNILTGLQLVQSIEASSLNGYITVLDTQGIIENATNPFRGEERLFLEIKGFDTNTVKVLDLFLYKIDNVTIKDTHDGARYVIHFVTTTTYLATTRKIIKPFYAPINEIVRDLFDEYVAGIKRLARPSDFNLNPNSQTFDQENILGADFFRYGTDKGIYIERTEGLFKCIIPNYRPHEAMYFLSSRAYSDESPSCSFKFFETTDGYMFVTDEYLIKYAVENKLEREFTYTPNVSKDMLSLPKQIYNLNHLENTKRVDTAGDLYSGAYTNNVVVLDLLTREMTENRYNYVTDGKPNYVKMERVQDSTSEIHTDPFISQTFNQENERKFLVIKDYDSNNGIQLRGEQYLPKIISNRVAYNHMLNNTMVGASIAGRIDIKAGDIAKLIIPEFTSATERKINPHLSGNYIIHTVEHTMTGRTLNTNLKLIKYGWSI